MSNNSIQHFEGHGVRITPDGKFVAVDVVKALGLKAPKRGWQNIKESYPELVAEIGTYSFGAGRPPEVLTEKGLLKLLMVAGGPKAAEFREWAATQLQRIAKGDITLADEIANRNGNARDLEWLGARSLARSSVLDLNSAVAAAGCSQKVYPKLHDGNNVAVTGMTAEEIKSERGVKQTRDGLDVVELGLMIALQGTQAKQIKNSGAKGDGQVLDIASDIAQKIAGVRKSLLGPRDYPHGGMLTTAI